MLFRSITDWLWDFGDDSTGTEQNPTHTYYVADTFTVSLSVSGPGGSNTYIRENYIIVTNPTIIQEDSDVLPTEFKLYNNYPNPFNPTTIIKYAIPQSPLPGEDGRGGLVTLKVYDVLGKEIKTLVNEEKPAGYYEVEFDATSLPSGVYFYQLKTRDYIKVRKMVLLR